MLRDAFVKFTRELAGTISIRKVSASAVHVNNETYTHSIVLTPDEILGRWHDKPVDELTAADFSALLDRKPDLVLLGTGPRNVFPPRDLVFAFARLGIGLEAMDSAAAARTFNVLAQEGRRVATVLYLQE